MKRLIRLCIFVGSLVLVFKAGEAGAQTTLDAAAVSTAGGQAAAGTLSLVGSVGQSGPAGEITSTPNFSITAGFIGTLGLAPDAEPPAISNTSAPATSAESAAVTVSATITDNDAVDSATLRYRAGGGSTFSSVAMTASGNSFQANIPANAVTSRGIEYYVEASDPSGNAARQPATGVAITRVTVAGEGVSRGSAQPSGTGETAYRLISVPLDLSNRTPSAVLVDDFGTYNNTEWRFFALRSDQSYAEFQNVSSVAAGMGYWLIVRSSGKTIDTGPGTSIATNQPFEVPLNAGWTFIGNPFNYSIPFSNLTLQSGETPDIRTYTGAWATASGSMQPFVGYAITNETQSQDRLQINPTIVAAKNESAPNTIAGADWFVRFEVTAGEARDDDNFLVAAASAAKGWDVMDRPEAPVIGDYVSAHFPHPDWEKPLSHYSVDARPSPEDGDTWELAVESMVVGQVKVTATGLEDVPDHYRVLLVDEFSGSHQDLRSNASFEYVNLEGGPARRFKVLVGQDQYLQDAIAKMEVVPDNFELDQNYPNPFNPTTIIRFGVPTNSEVSLQVFDVLGRRVATLLSGEEKVAGFHSIPWNGRADSGEQVASGVYLYQLRAGKHVITRKMLMVK